MVAVFQVVSYRGGVLLQLGEPRLKGIRDPHQNLRPGNDSVAPVFGGEVGASPEGAAVGGEEDVGNVEVVDALAVVVRRAELMQEAVPPDRGAMAAILGLEDESVTRACDEAAGGQIVVPVNFNAPGQVVIAGEREAVERAVGKAKEAGAKRAMMLRVSVPSHSPLMEPAAEGLVEHLDGIGIRQPEIPVLDAVAVAPYEDPARIRKGLKNQVHNPVRWTDTVRKLREDGIDLFVECGPGKVLAGLVRRIDRDAVAIAVDDPESLDKALAAARDDD